MAYFMAMLYNMVAVMSTLAACCYLATHDHVGLAIGVLFLPLFIIVSVSGNGKK